MSNKNTIEGKAVPYSNFSGKKEQFFGEGHRHFIVKFHNIVDGKKHEHLGTVHYNDEDDSAWMNVKICNAEYEEFAEYLPFAKIYTSDGYEYDIARGLCGVLDNLNIKSIDVEVSPRHITHNNRTITMAYVAVDKYPYMPITVCISDTSDRYEMVVNRYIFDLRQKNYIESRRKFMEKVTDSLDTLEDN